MDCKRKRQKDTTDELNWYIREWIQSIIINIHFLLNKLVKYAIFN